MQRHCKFLCEGVQLVGTLTNAPGTTGLLIVSGGNEIRAGAWNSHTRLAARLAAQGFPVFRFDRRGIGDSEGENGGFLSSESDIRAALAAFRSAAPHVRRVIAFGNCDAASALMLGAGCGCDALVLSNPWTLRSEFEDGTPPPPRRAYYFTRLRRAETYRRLFSGEISIRSLAQFMRSLITRLPPTALAQDMATGLAAFTGPVVILLAGRDRTAQIFRLSWDKRDPRVRQCPVASHSYVEPHAQNWLEVQLLEALSSASG